MLESGPLGFLAGRSVFEDLLTAGVLSSVVLSIQMLICRRDAGVAHEHGAAPHGHTTVTVGSVLIWVPAAPLEDAYTAK